MHENIVTGLYVLAFFLAACFVNEDNPRKQGRYGAGFFLALLVALTI